MKRLISFLIFPLCYQNIVATFVFFSFLQGSLVRRKSLSSTFLKNNLKIQEGTFVIPPPAP